MTVSRSPSTSAATSLVSAASTVQANPSRLGGRGESHSAVTAVCDSPRPPNRDGFAWTVLAALTNEVGADVDGDKLTVTLARGTSDTE